MMAVKKTKRVSDWMYHAPSEVNFAPVPIPAPSNIAGLAPHLNTTEIPEQVFKRGWVRDGDSKYVQLCKTGGRQGLLHYKEITSAKNAAPVGYARCDWFDHDRLSDDEGIEPKVRSAPPAPEWYKDEPDTPTSNEPYEQQMKKRAPYGFDKLSNWERQEEEDRVKLKSLKKKKVSRSKSDVPQFPKICPRGGMKPAVDDGDIDTLLRYGYQKKSLDEIQDRAAERRRKKSDERKIFKQKLLDNDSQRLQKSKIQQEDENKPIFKISKFNNVNSKVDSHR